MCCWIYLSQPPKLDICVGNTEFVRIDVWGRQIFTPWVCCWPDPLTKCSNIWQPEMRFQINYLSPKSLCARFYSLLLINASTPEFEYRPGFIVINFKVLTLWSSIRPCLGLFSNCIEQIMPCLTLDFNHLGLQKKVFQLFIHFGCQYRIDEVLQLTEDGDGSVQLELSSVIINTL